MKSNVAGQVGVILSHIWSHKFYKLLCGLLVQDLRTQLVVQLFSSAEIISMASVTSKDHYGTLRGERKWLQHTSAQCWVDSRISMHNTKFSKECPLASVSTKPNVVSSADSPV